MNTLIVTGHPRRESLTSALAHAYAEGARAAGCRVAELHLGELDFDPDVSGSSPCDQPLEPDLERAKDLIAWAEHLVFAFPNWWGVMPARLKGFLDRVLLPGFAFREQDGHYYGLLHGRTAELLISMDVPPFVYRWIQGAPGARSLARCTLGICGIETIRVTPFARPNHSTRTERVHWLERARALGFRLKAGARTPLQEAAHAARTWFAVLRPQFYPMSVLGYIAGALAAAGPLRGSAFLFGHVFMVALKAATVLTNDIYDRESDAENRRWSPFTGGSRGLHEKGVGVASYWKAVRGALLLSLLGAGGLLLAAPEPVPVLVTAIVLAIVALGYTVPPLALSHRGLGELDVAVTHGPGVVLLGYVGQGGSLADPGPWLLGAVIGLAVLPAIVLSGIPDRAADEKAGKRTLAVSFGCVGATRLALLLLLLSGGSVLLVSSAAPLGTERLAWFAVPHAGLMGWLLVTYLREGAPERRIDGLMVAALLYIGWFVIVPVLGLFGSGAAGPSG